MIVNLAQKIGWRTRQPVYNDIQENTAGDQEKVWSLLTRHLNPVRSAAWAMADDITERP